MVGDNLNAILSLDKSGLVELLLTSEVNKKTPSEGAENTARELTAHADSSSMEAVENPISELSRRQLRTSAVDDFAFWQQPHSGDGIDFVSAYRVLIQAHIRSYQKGE